MSRPAAQWFGDRGPYGELSLSTVVYAVLIALLLGAPPFVSHPFADWGLIEKLPIGHLGIAALLLLLAPPLVSLRRPALPRPLALLIALLAACIGGVAFQFWLVPGARLVFDEFAAAVWFSARFAFFQWGMAVAAWYYVDRSRRRGALLREAEAARAQLATGSLEAQLAMMQAQIEPHFLFNTLAHVRRLYRTEPALGERMLAATLTYLRIALPQFRTSGATLAEELDLTTAYLEVVQIRMGNRLAYAIDVPQSLRGTPLPPLTILTLVENAIKHGLTPQPQGGRVEIVAHRDGDSLRINVVDTGAGLNPRSSGSGLGLASIRARLLALHGRAAGVDLRRNEPTGVIAELVVPLGTASTSLAPC